MKLNPYQAWLRIAADRLPPDDLPPNHYDLLGLARFESDPDRIQQAYQSRYGHIRRYEVGRHGELATRVLAELSKALVELSDPAKKAAYDAGLREKSPGILGEELADWPAEAPQLPGTGLPQTGLPVTSHPTRNDPASDLSDAADAAGTAAGVLRTPVVWVGAAALAALLLAMGSAAVWFSSNRSTRRDGPVALAENRHSGNDSLEARDTEGELGGAAGEEESAGGVAGSSSGEAGASSGEAGAGVSGVGDGASVASTFEGSSRTDSDSSLPNLGLPADVSPVDGSGKMSTGQPAISNQPPIDEGPSVPGGASRTASADDADPSDSMFRSGNGRGAPPVVGRGAASPSGSSGTGGTGGGEEDDSASTVELARATGSGPDDSLTRVWSTRARSYQVQAEYVGYKDDRVVLRRTDDLREVELELEQLSETDCQWVRRREASRLDGLLREARQAIDLGELGRVRQILATDTVDDDIRPDFLLGLVEALVAKDPAEARKCFSRCVHQLEDHVPSLNNLACTEIRLGKPDDAVKHWRRAVQAAPEEPAPRQNLLRVGQLIAKNRLRLGRTVTEELTQLLADDRVTRDSGWQYLDFVPDENVTDFYQVVALWDGRPRLDAMCMQCNGMELINCPNNYCKRGKVYVTQQQRLATTPAGTVFRSRKVPIACQTCRGQGQLRCPFCSNGIDRDL